MRATIPTVAGAAGQSDVATPHELEHDSLHVIPMRSTDQVKAAGSVYLEHRGYDAMGPVPA